MPRALSTLRRFLRVAVSCLALVCGLWIQVQVVPSACVLMLCVLTSDLVVYMLIELQLLLKTNYMGWGSPVIASLLSDLLDISD